MSDKCKGACEHDFSTPVCQAFLFSELCPTFVLVGFLFLLQPWPEDGLKSVASSFLLEVDMSNELRDACVTMCIAFHKSSMTLAKRFWNELRRYYYTTPTSYLEMITTFKSLLRWVPAE